MLEGFKIAALSRHQDCLTTIRRAGLAKHPGVPIYSPNVVHKALRLINRAYGGLLQAPLQTPAALVWVVDLIINPTIKA